ncbi:MAG: hypothetical protein NT069_30435 [Planctomycetota bacterium]|nr:hypothetical protein [Planctomycetota bacterium]
MLKVTTPAAARMAQLLKAEGTTAVLRIVRRNKRLKIKVSALQPGDQTFAHNGKVVLAIDSKVSPSLSKRQLDLRQTDSGPRLKMLLH